MDRLSEKNSKILVQTVNLIDQITFVGNYSLTKFSTSDHELIKFFYINYLERFSNGLESTNLLLKHFNGRFENSIGLILRAGLLDFLFATYFSILYSEVKTEKDKSEFEIKLQELVADQIRNTIKFLKRYTNKTGPDYKKGIDHLWIQFPFLFTTSDIDYDSPESKLITAKYISPELILKRLTQHEKAEYYRRSYDAYYYYGKYEHFGLITHKSQRQGINVDFDNIMVALDYLIEGLLVCHAFFNLIEEKEKLLSLQNEFRKL